MITGLVAAGFVSGIISGMGIGGGTVLIPVLSIFFDMPQKSVQSINLVYFIPTATAALINHIKNNRVEKSNLKFIIPAGILGALLGGFTALGLDNGILRRLFGTFLLLMGVREIMMGVKNNKKY